MDSVSGRSVLLVASLQAAISIAALSSSPASAIAASAIGALALGRYLALALFARTVGAGAGLQARFLSASAWILGLAAMLAALAAVALRAKPALPWAVAAALAGPLGMSALALGSGVGAVAAGRRASGHAGGDR
jgi:hypothetical protein